MKVISSNVFLSSYSLKYFCKNATICSSRNKGVTFNTSNIRYLFCNKRTEVFLEVQMSEDQGTSLLVIKTYSFDAAACHLFYT